MLEQYIIYIFQTNYKISSTEITNKENSFIKLSMNYFVLLINFIGNRLHAFKK
jgi:hypothetical protein